MCKIYLGVGVPLLESRHIRRANSYKLNLIKLKEEQDVHVRVNDTTIYKYICIYIYDQRQKCLDDEDVS